MANDGIQAFGGYGYMREYEVEKIKRDIKILPLYEGTSEIQQNIISVFRLRETVRSKGGFYMKMAEKLDGLSTECAGPLVARAIRITSEVIMHARKVKLSKSQYAMFLLADMMTWCEVGGALCCKAAVYQGKQIRSPLFIKAAARIFARQVLEKVYVNGLKIVYGCDQTIDELKDKMGTLDLGLAMTDNLKDMDLIASELVA
jgi:alkylation response protein AidB-like acyl-CoA dehydrogenase